MLFAVHISDGVLMPAWIAAGHVLALALVALGTWKLHEDDVPRIALLTAVFFIASTIHIPLGGTSIHLLFNGLVGVLLGRRAGIAIPIGLGLQAMLLNHGGFATIGINACVLGLPALLAGWAFRTCHSRTLLKSRWFRSGLMIASTLLWLACLLYGARLLFDNFGTQTTALDVDSANRLFREPWLWLAAVTIAAVLVWLETRWDASLEFALGFLLGQLTVLLTIALNLLVLLFGGETYWSAPPLILFLAYLPLAVVEGLILGVTLRFLSRVKPELLQ